MKDRNSKEELRGDIIFLNELKKAIDQNDSEHALKLVEDWAHELNELDSKSPVITPWCRIYIVEGQQVLVKIKMNTEDDQMELSQCVYLKDMFMEASIGFDESNTTAEEQFGKYTQTRAEKFYNAMIKFLE